MRASSLGKLRIHAGVDVVLLSIGFAAPWLFGYSDLRYPTLYTLALVLAGLAVNSITDYPGGLIRKLPFRWHRLIEFVSPLPFIVVPWLFFAGAGFMPWVLSAIGVAIVINAAFPR